MIEETELKHSKLEISELEKKYFHKLEKVFKSQNFLRDVKDLENRVRDNYETLKLIWLKSNKIDIALERLTKYYLFRNEMVERVYTSPISSDIAFYTKDCIICLDTKSVNYISNSPDIGLINTSRNQINFSNKLCRNVPYITNLPSNENGIPILTYFLQLEYEEDIIENNFDIINFNLSCVPNYFLSDIYDNDIIMNYKTYEYVGNELSEELELIGYPDLAPVEDINENWIKKSSTIYCDEFLENPYYKNGTLFKKYRNDYRAIISGSSARIDPKKLKTNKDKSYNWNRHISWKI